MEKEKISLEAPLDIGKVRLIPVTRVLIHAWPFKKAVTCFGMKHPLAVIVITGEATRAFRYSGEPVSLHDLAREMPAIRGDLEGLGS